MKAAILFLLGTVPLLARLGDTPDQSKERYGSILQQSAGAPDCVEMDFEKNGVRIEEYFYKGTCVKIELKKTHGEVLSDGAVPIYKDGSTFTDAEVRVIIEQNNEGKTWDSCRIIRRSHSCLLLAFRWGNRLLDFRGWDRN